MRAGPGGHKLKRMTTLNPSACNAMLISPCGATLRVGVALQMWTCSMMNEVRPITLR